MLKNKRLLTILRLIPLALLTFAVPAVAGDISTVFYIANSDNTSQVHYGIRLNSDCSAVRQTPVYAYWLRPDGSTRPLNRQEQDGYGISSQSVTGNTVNLSISGFQRYGVQKSLSVTTSKLSNGNCQARAFTTIAESRTQLAYARIQVNSKKILGQTVQVQVQTVTLVGANQKSETIACRTNCQYGIPLP